MRPIKVRTVIDPMPGMRVSFDSFNGLIACLILEINGDTAKCKITSPKYNTGEIFTCNKSRLVYRIK